MLAFVEARLDGPVRASLDAHLAECPECRQLVSALAQGGLALGDTAHSERPPPMPTAVMSSSPPTPSDAPKGHPHGSPLAGAFPLVRPGDRIADRYVVERPLGSGGMGIVVAARHVGLDRSFAVKLLDPRYTGSREAAARFLREARASALLRGEHIVQVTDTGETRLPNQPEGQTAPFLVMELLDGDDLGKFVAKRAPMPTAEAVWIVLQACEALAEAHHANIVHRDVKPATLIVTRKVDGTPHLKVVDFGISKAHDIARSLGSLTSQNVVMGTPRYMAPEQMRSSKDVDGRADVWALGAVLYELLAGKPAFEAPSLTELITRVQLEEPAHLGVVAPHVPKGLAYVVHECLRKSVSERVTSVADLARRIAPFAPASAHHHVARAERWMSGARPSLPPKTATPVPLLSGSPLDTTRNRRKRTTLGVSLSIGGLLVGVSLTALVLWLREPHERATTETPMATSASASSPPSLPLALPTQTQSGPDLPSARPTPPALPAAGGTNGKGSPSRVAPALASATSEPSAPTVTPPRPTASATVRAPDDPHNLRQRE